MQPDPNEVTLAAYEKGYQLYIDATPPEPLNVNGPWLPTALELRPPGSTVLEIGSGTGHDAAKMEALGVPVERSDAASSFVNYLRGQGHEARNLNVLTDEIGGPYGMIFAFAVFQHFTWAQFCSVLGKCARSLQPGGILAFSVRRGDLGAIGGGYRSRKGMDPRFFYFWQPGPLWGQVEGAGLRVLSIHQDAAVARDGDQETKNWLMVTAVRD